MGSELVPVNRYLPEARASTVERLPPRHVSVSTDPHYDVESYVDYSEPVPYYEEPEPPRVLRNVHTIWDEAPVQELSPSSRVSHPVQYQRIPSRPLWPWRSLLIVTFGLFFLMSVIFAVRPPWDIMTVIVGCYLLSAPTLVLAEYISLRPAQEREY